MGSLFSGSGGQSSTSSNSSNSTTHNTFDSPQFNSLVTQALTQAGTLSDPSKSPYQTYGGQVFAPFQQDQTNAFTGVQNAQGQAQPYYNAGANTLGSGLQQAGGYFNRAGQQPTALQAGSPYAQMAGQTWNNPYVQQSYLNPYINNTVDVGNKLATQNFLQNTLPGINNEFVASGGGLGSSQYGRAADWATTNFNNSLNNADQQALANAYQGSAGIFSNDQSRLAGLSGTVGNQAATSAGTLAGLGSAAANTGISGAGAFGSLGSGAQSNNLTGLNALLQVGNQQQQQAQNPLTYNYQQFQNSVNWPYQLTQYGANIAGGLTGSVPTTSNTNAQSNSTSNQSSSGSGSPFGSILGGLSTFGGLGGFGAISNLFSGAGGGVDPTTGAKLKRGGYFGLDAPSRPSYIDTTKRFARGGRTGYFADGGPISFSPSMSLGPLASSSVDPTADQARDPIRAAHNDFSTLANTNAQAIQSLAQHPSSGGGSSGGGSSGGGMGALMQFLPLAMSFLNRGGRVGIDKPSRPYFYSYPMPPQGRGGFGGIDASSEPSTVDTTKRFARGGFFAAGGHAPVVRAANTEIRNDIAQAQREQARLQAPGGQPGMTRRLQPPQGHFARGGGMPPAFMIHPSSRPGYFSRNA